MTRTGLNAVLLAFSISCACNAALAGDCNPPPLNSPASWLPLTPEASTKQPPTHEQGGTDCPFYQGAWQRFLYVTQPDENGRPAFLSYPSIEDLFGHLLSPNFAKQIPGVLSLAPRFIERPNTLPPKLAEGTFQAKSHGLLIDTNGHPIFYAIHVNPAYRDFLIENHLVTTVDLQQASPDLKFPPGVIELKSAWAIVNDSAPPKGYFVTAARVPRLSIIDGKIVTTNTTRTVTVALIAIHVVFTLDHHPEMIWSTFEHVDTTTGLPDNAPGAQDNPSRVTGDPTVCGKTYLLCAAETKSSQANQVPSVAAYLANFNEAEQTFNKTGSIFSTPVYRLYPGSKSDVKDEDDEVASINQAMRAMLMTAKLPASDKRPNYQLIGAVWLDDPDSVTKGFGLHKTFDVAEGQSTDSLASEVAGEGRLSSTAMESFTQDKDDFPQCFSCHNTSAVFSDVPHRKVLDPKLLNVSHVMSKFLSGAALQDAPQGSRPGAAQ